YNSSYDVTCSNFGYDGGSISCNSRCLYSLSACYIKTGSSTGSRCGNNDREGNEQCDGTDLNSVSCTKLSYTSGTVKLNYTGGTLSCNKDCTFNVTKCTTGNVIDNTNKTKEECTINKLKDGTETGIDCGGGCPPCALNVSCSKDSDCTSGKCSFGKCVINTCNNSKFDNGTESDVDCGNICKSCGIGKNCARGSDCITGYCSDGICTEDKCTNSLRDDGEVDVDCGGECMLCDIGQSCVSDEDCSSGNCDDEICAEAKPSVNPIKLPLMLAGIIFILAGAGYIIYKAFIVKPPIAVSKYGYAEYAAGIAPGSNGNNMPTLTPEERKELIKKQQEAMLKKRESRNAERKDVLQKLNDSDKKDDSNKDVKTAVIKVGGSSDGEYVELSKLNKDNEDYVDLLKVKDSKDAETNKTFEKLKDISKGRVLSKEHIQNKEEKQSTSENIEKDKTTTKQEKEEKQSTSEKIDKDKTIKQDIKKTKDAKIIKKISKITGKPAKSIRPKIGGNKKISHTDMLNVLGQMDKGTIMSKAFTDVLSQLLKSGKMNKDNVSNILFEYMDKGLLTKSDVAKISSKLKII
ncbi:MAG: hypothetical protein ACP5OA_05705, partial [Candidatus Woesearchaeota archaeon]